MLWQVRDIPISIQNVFYEYLKTILARQPLVGVLSLLRLRGIFLEPFCHISAAWCVVCEPAPHEMIVSPPVGMKIAS